MITVTAQSEATQRSTTARYCCVIQNFTYEGNPGFTYVLLAVVKLNSIFSFTTTKL